MSPGASMDVATGVGASAEPAELAAARAESSVPRRVWGATMLSALARQWGALCTLLALALLARALPLDEFGRFTFWVGVLAFADVLVDCGTSTAAVRRAAGEPASLAAAIAAARRVRAATAGIAALAMAAGALAAGEQEIGWVLAAALSPFSRVAEASAIVFQRDIAWGRPLALRALGGTARLALIAALARVPGLGFGPFLLAHAASLALGNVALHFAARRRLPPPELPIRGLLASALPLAALGLVQQAYLYADNLFVRALAGAEELGRYNAAVRAFLWLAFFAAFATTSALPWLARRHAAGGLGAAASRLALPLSLGAGLVAGALAPWSGELLALAFGPEFEAAGPSLVWLLAALLAVAPGAAFLTAVIAAGAERAALGVAAVALVANLGANAALVPSLGAEGAAIATLATEAVVALGALAALRRLGATPRRAWAPFAVGAAALGVAWLVSGVVAGGVVGG